MVRVLSQAACVTESSKRFNTTGLGSSFALPHDQNLMLPSLALLGVSHIIL